ncbi:hypothetical protein RBWH47_02432 [Rhodopirellula baltica WH47]|uniref:Uncharacterized protein n=2 Tax=Rhodopirellula baltica TaxID=265606 RepID=F2AXR7_RHOBT|nr:hypothetical protein RBWH47_02432 [Rhodopirellula baltica WH47]ELP31667.1 hypothetical protein RBSWK_04460 [Rhodopirellula baltica SWK14]
MTGHCNRLRPFQTYVKRTFRWKIRSQQIIPLAMIDHSLDQLQRL